MLINIHTHQLNSTDFGLRFIDGVHSRGIHPWQLIAPFERDHYQLLFHKLKEEERSPIFAIGECGLDRKKADLAPIDMQLSVLEWHFSWAQEKKLPLIIHCVGAFSELLHLLKETKFKGKFLLHDFSGNLQIAKELLRYDAYFSFGKRLFQEKTHAHEVLLTLPLERLFLETDNQDEKKIGDIYQKAAGLLSLSPKNLEEQLEKNLEVFFSDQENISATDILNNLRSGL